ncbi:CBS domain-containing protein [Kitasatospora sp. NPDC059646]|uniref:CBS domain-containing protein n=1 Tax=Kitasatospora sp. NPDC059646 TaxID=3346893 RepID=UPI0036AB3B7A
MRHCTVGTVMTRQVVTVSPGTGFREIVALLAEYDITAVPVVDADHRPLGVVSEADLLRTQLAQYDPASLLPAPVHLRGTGTTAADLMTAPAVCTTPDSTVVAAARLMSRRRVKRLPVVSPADGRLIGTVSRGDLLRVFLRDDHAIRREIVEDVLTALEGASPSLITVDVSQGEVTLSGTTAPHCPTAALRELCAAVDGVVSVTDRTTRPLAPLAPAGR